MNIGEWLDQATKTLKKTGIDSARLDSLILLEKACRKDRSHLLAHPELTLQGSSLKLLNESLAKRQKREPIAYITGYKEFYGHVFLVNKDVMIPRPESESFLELLKLIKPKQKQKLLDVGTGSGCLAISAKLHFPHLDVTGCDISVKALKTAKNNAKKLDANIKFVQSDLLNNVAGQFDYIFANLPYVPFDYMVSSEVNLEPQTAIYADNKGLELIKNLGSSAKFLLKPSGYLFIESSIEQQNDISDYLAKLGYTFCTNNGLVQVFKH